MSDSFLLLTKMREMVFRKPEQKADAPADDAATSGAKPPNTPMREPAARPVLALLTDFGTRDPYVGAMKGAALSVCADATLVDITHDIAAHDVAEAARHSPRRRRTSRRARRSWSSSIRASAARGGRWRRGPADTGSSDRTTAC